jgi:murein peptide amidase A
MRIGTGRTTKRTILKNMKALLPSRHTPVPSGADALRAQQNSIQKRLKPLLDLAENSDYLIAGSVGEFLVRDELFQIPRFTFIGPTGGGDTIRIGIFAGIHGDEPEGTEAVMEFLQKLERKPRLATGYHLYVYPVCNPTGFLAQTRKNSSGEDLLKHFWRRSSQPEIYYLERELGVLRFQGVISLHVKDDSEAFLLRTNSQILNRDVIQPAIHTTQKRLSAAISEAEPNKDLPENFLTAGDELDPVPFELQFGIPRNLPPLLRINGTIHLLNSILDSYHSFLSISQNL